MQHDQPDNPPTRGVARRLEALIERVMGVALPIGLTAWDGSRAGPSGTPRVILRNRRALRHVVFSPGELGLARAFVVGDLDVEGDPAEGLRLCWRTAREHSLSSSRPGPREWSSIVVAASRLGVLGWRPRPPESEARPRGKLHGRRRDSSVISHHYDLGNEFYELLLDERMTYSCGYWRDDDPNATLADAQRDKLDLICRKLDLGTDDRLLDVGCGWGSLILYAARRYGVRATGVTLSAQQAEFIRRRVDELGLRDRVEVRGQDYRELAEGERFDAVASVEMGEHVGADNYPEYLSTLRRALRPRGGLLLQQMSRGDSAPGGGPFIESYIAPDMNMVPLGTTISRVERAGFEVRDVHAMREHYVRTVRTWADTLRRRWGDAVALIGEQRARVWWLYLAGGALAFEQNRMGVHQILGTRATEDGDGAAIEGVRPAGGQLDRAEERTVRS